MSHLLKVLQELKGGDAGERIRVIVSTLYPPETIAEDQYQPQRTRVPTGQDAQVTRRFEQGRGATRALGLESVGCGFEPTGPTAVTSTISGGVVGHERRRAAY
jgi:hypothetical protein